MRWFMLLPAMLALLLVPSASDARATPQLSVRAPANAVEVTGPSVTVEFDVADIAFVPPSVPWEQAGSRGQDNRPSEGHLLLMLDLWPPVVWDKTEPYTFVNVPSGEHQLKVELVNNDHSSMTPPLVQTARFKTVVPMPAALPVMGDGPLLSSTLRAIVFGLSGLSLVAAGLRLRRQRRSPRTR